MLFNDYVPIKMHHALKRTHTIRASAAQLGFLFLFPPLFLIIYFLQVVANATIGYLNGSANGLQCWLDKVDQNSCV